MELLTLYFSKENVLSSSVEQGEKNFILETSKLVPYSTNNKDQKITNHFERGKAGAERLIWGKAIKENPEKNVYVDRENFLEEESNVDFVIGLLSENKELEDDLILGYSCLFIDDCGVKSNWVKVLSELLVNTHVEYFKYDKNFDNNDLLDIIPGIDYVFLDLKLPDKDGDLSIKTGLSLLENLKENYPFLPVVVITANDDVITFRDAHKKGAFSVFPKTNEDFYEVKSNEYFTTYYDRFIRIIGQIHSYLNSKTYATSQKLEVFKFNVFWFLKYIEMPWSFLSVGKKNISEWLQFLTISNIHSALYICSSDKSLSNIYLLNRLFLFSQNIERGKSDNVPIYHSIIAGSKVAELLMKIILFCYDPDHFNAKQTPTNMLRKKTDQDLFKVKYQLLYENYMGIWEFRNEVKNNHDVEIETIHTKIEETIEFLKQCLLGLYREHNNIITDENIHKELEQIKEQYSELENNFENQLKTINLSNNVEKDKFKKLVSRAKVHKKLLEDKRKIKKKLSDCDLQSDKLFSLGNKKNAKLSNKNVVLDQKLKVVEDELAIIDLNTDKLPGELNEIILNSKKLFYNSRKMEYLIKRIKEYRKFLKCIPINSHNELIKNLQRVCDEFNKGCMLNKT